MRCEKLSRSLAIIQLTNMTAKGRGLGSMNPPQTWFLIQVGVFQVPGPHEGLSGLTLSPPACPSLFLTNFGGEIHSMVSASKRNEARCSVHDRYAHIVVFSKCLHWQMQICDNTIPRSTLQQKFPKRRRTCPSVCVLFNLYQAGFLCASRSYPTPNWFLFVLQV